MSKRHDKTLDSRRSYESWSLYTVSKEWRVIWSSHRRFGFKILELEMTLFTFMSYSGLDCIVLTLASLLTMPYLCDSEIRKLLNSLRAYCFLLPFSISSAHRGADPMVGIQEHWLHLIWQCAKCWAVKIE